MTEVWFRNPLNYIKECAELLVPNIAWDGGLLWKRGLDAQRWLDMHYPSAIDYRILIVSDQGSMELRRNTNIAAPTAVYPTWRYGDHNMDDLREMLENPLGENRNACDDQRLDPMQRPIFGQEHRVVVARWPDGHTHIGRSFLRELTFLQQDYPDAIIHLHGSYSWRFAFGMGFAAADVDPREDASKGRIILGSGKVIKQEQAPKHSQWVTLMGMTQGELDVPRNRCMFNIKSALWAGENYMHAVAFRSQGLVKVDPAAITHMPALTKSPFADTGAVAQPGDKISCDSCSLSLTCKYYRDGAVCTLPKAETKRLATQFKTRDSHVVLEGLSQLLQLQADRLENAVEAEQFAGDDLDHEVTVAANQLFKQGATFAKLIDPVLAAAGATKIGVFVNGQPQNDQLTPQAQIAQAVRELEAQGTPRDSITEEMLINHMRHQVAAIEASASESP